jgi:hypothetical protein
LEEAQAKVRSKATAIGMIVILPRAFVVFIHGSFSLSKLFVMNFPNSEIRLSGYGFNAGSIALFLHFSSVFLSLLSYVFGEMPCQ